MVGSLTEFLLVNFLFGCPDVTSRELSPSSLHGLLYSPLISVSLVFPGSISHQRVDLGAV